MLVTSNVKVFEKPPTGIYHAVFADYVDLGLQPSPFKPEPTPRVRLLWILDALDKAGEHYQVVQEVTASMFTKSKLYAVVKNITGSDPGESFELENLIGKVNKVVVKAEVSKTGKPYSKIDSFLPADKAFPIPATYVRKKDRPAKTYGATAPAVQQTVAIPAAPIDEESIPF